MSISREMKIIDFHIFLKKFSKVNYAHHIFYRSIKIFDPTIHNSKSKLEQITKSISTDSKHRIFLVGIKKMRYYSRERAKLRIFAKGAYLSKHPLFLVGVQNAPGPVRSSKGCNFRAMCTPHVQNCIHYIGNCARAAVHKIWDEYFVVCEVFLCEFCSVLINDSIVCRCSFMMNIRLRLHKEHMWRQHISVHSFIILYFFIFLCSLYGFILN